MEKKKSTQFLIISSVLKISLRNKEYLELENEIKMN